MSVKRRIFQRFRHQRAGELLELEREIANARGAVAGISCEIDGQGIALARTALASWDMLSGRLVRPFPQALEAPYAFWIVCPKSAAELPKISTFRNWLLEEAAEDARRLAELDARPRARAARR